METQGEAPSESSGSGLKSPRSPADPAVKVLRRRSRELWLAATTRPPPDTGVEKSPGTSPQESKKSGIGSVSELLRRSSRDMWLAATVSEGREAGELKHQDPDPESVQRRDSVSELLRRSSRDMWLAAMSSEGSEGKAEKASADDRRSGRIKPVAAAKAHNNRRGEGSANDHSGPTRETEETGKKCHSNTVDSLSSQGQIDITKAPSFGSSVGSQEDVVRALRSWSRRQWSLDAQDTIAVFDASSEEERTKSPVLNDEHVFEAIEKETAPGAALRQRPPRRR
ncbi:hypothetical protein BESB_072500 [Besnoitia besnoiti]|uniref:Uncharacterized protein n=1 Tax=Besnoitia besnoiti TaxID=94643 RepID=A0A2A9M6J8_BESBE|nr:uncharacterized protein BESB_072500 [Besnoitia besnoiti]PFH34098.1 hypothetical protein BESB_072500 [Besnoitia besnoiti]